MKVLSLFDGISCARVALERAGIKVDSYYASEIDKYAIQVSKKNWPNIVHLGSVTEMGMYDDQYRTLWFGGKCKEWKHTLGIDLMIGGSPCQDLSIANKDRKGLDGDRSGLFWEYVRILKEVKPKYFILENVASMPKEAKALITETLGVEPIMIDAALVSAQRRKRLFWTNIPGLAQPEDRGILLKDILENDVDTVPLKKEIKGRIAGWSENENTILAYNGDKKRSTISEKVYHKVESKTNAITLANTANVVYPPQSQRVYSIAGLYFLPDGTLQVREATKKGFAVAKDGDSVDLSFPTSETRRGRVGNKAKNLMTSGNGIHAFTQGQIRKLTPIECERLQGLPDNYTEGVSNSQRYKSLGNAFNVDVVAHILSFIP